jgi:DNA-binding NarL/FixJ family response regulator
MKTVNRDWERIRVIVIGGGNGVHETLKQWLREDARFYFAGCNTGGATELEQFRATPPDVAILDLESLGAKGAELIRGLKQEIPAIKIIVISREIRDETFFDLLDAGADGYLDKPIERVPFMKQLNQLMAGGCPLSARTRPEPSVIF